MPVQTRKVKHYLVKWRALAYEDSTWELEDDIRPNQSRTVLEVSKNAAKERMETKEENQNLADWKKIEDSPVYKGGNTLQGIPIGRTELAQLLLV